MPAASRQVFSNLLSNAVKLSSAGGRMELTLQRAGGAYEIRVADTGIGIAADFLPHVFERFRQSDGSMTREYGGLGLGLAIVKELTELQGGAVQVASDGPGRGTASVVRLPALVTLEVAAASVPAAPVVSSVALAGIRVLAVDDNPDELEVLATTLATAGATVRVAGDGGDAVSQWREDPGDVLICDLAMPHMDGFAVLRTLQSDGAEGAVRALALTAHASQDYIERTTAAGFVGHVAKPFAAADLVTAVAKAATRE